MFYAPGEAEATCAALDSAGAVHGVASLDGDALSFGATAVYRTLSLSVSRKGERDDDPGKGAIRGRARRSEPAGEEGRGGGGVEVASASSGVALGS